MSEPTILYTDASWREAAQGGGWAVVDANGRALASRFCRAPSTVVLERRAVHAAVRIAAGLPKPVEIRTDCKAARSVFAPAGVRVVWVRRTRNADADRAARRASTRRSRTAA